MYRGSEQGSQNAISACELLSAAGNQDPEGSQETFTSQLKLGAFLIIRVITRKNFL